MKKTVILSIVYMSVVLLVLWLIMSVASQKSVAEIMDSEQLHEFDFAEECGKIGSKQAECYFDRLLSPEEIKEYEPNDEKDDYSHYVTYRYIIPVTDGANYGITFDKSNYALNVFIDGELKVKTGNVADNEDDFIPTSAAYSAYFTGKGDTVEIIFQQANFNHSKHHRQYFIMGPAGEIADYITMYILESSIFASVLLTAWLINLGLFMFFREKKELLWFSLLCLSAGINKIVPNLTSYIVPDMNWSLSHRLETCSLILAMLFMILYLASLFKEYVNWKIVNGSCCITLAVLSVFAFTPSLFYSRCNEAAIILEVSMMIPMFISLTIKVIKHIKEIPFTKQVAILGMLIFVVLTVSISIDYFRQVSVNLLPVSIGISVFVFHNSLALLLDFRNTNDMLEKVEAREREMTRANEILSRLDRVREAFLADLSHELKTPLTVIASNAALSSKMVSMGKANEMTVSKLNSIEQEAVRLGKMVERLKNSAEGQYNEKAENLNMNRMLSAAADFCNPLCARNGNTIVLKCESDIYAFISANTLFHCLYSLISNATRHCRDSEIELVCARNEGSVVVSVRDHGEGMDDEAKSNAFKRGFSGDSSTGIGLPLCRELIENEGGMMILEDTPGGGLTVSFSIKEGKENGENTDD